MQLPNETAPLDWESELGSLLADLSTVQQELLDVIGEKRSLMIRGDLGRLSELQHREAQVQDRLEGCYRRRLDLLALARQNGRAVSDIRQLASSLPATSRDKIGKQVKDAGERSRFIQYESLTNWVLAQRSLLHLSQLLEIIATGGRLQPTYGTGDPALSQGCVLDHTV